MYDIMTIIATHLETRQSAGCRQRSVWLFVRLSFICNDLRLSMPDLKDTIKSMFQVISALPGHT